MSDMEDITDLEYFDRFVEMADMMAAGELPKPDQEAAKRIRAKLVSMDYPCTNENFTNLLDAASDYIEAVAHYHARRDSASETEYYAATNRLMAIVIAHKYPPATKPQKL